ncbi:MAG: glycosyltransferase [Cyanobacteria bacterium P01_G01_bin.49]
MKKIMFYCQNLLGMGHLVRTTEIIRSLIKDFKVCLVDGGQIVAGFDIPKEVEVVHLPAIRAEYKQIKVVDSSLSLEELQQLRKQKLLQTFEQFQPDCLITEGYPFSKKKSLSFELVPLLEKIQSEGKKTKVVCSLRDIIMVKQYRDRTQEEEKRCQFMNQYYDMLLIHSDPKIHRLEENFSRAKDLTCSVHYTGYVAQSLPENPILATEDLVGLNKQKPMILVSVGGGRLGHDLLDCMIDTASIIQKKIPHHIQIFTGPFMPEEKFSQLQTLAADLTNITIRRYTSNLLSYLKKASISISLGGYNTTMNVLRTEVNAMIYPSNKDSEQMIRAEKLEKLGILKVIRPEDLQSDHLAQKIITCLKQDSLINTHKILQLEGAKKTAQCLKELLQTQVTATAA